MYAINCQNQFASDRIDIESGGDPLWVDGVLGWWQSSLAAGRKTHLCLVRQHIRVYATNAFGQFTNTGATLNWTTRKDTETEQKTEWNMCAKPSNVIAQAALIELPVGANYSAMCT